MISTHEEAITHARHTDKKHSNVIVLSDGQIYAGEKEVQKAIDSNDTVFIVRGELKKKKKKTDD